MGINKYTGKEEYVEYEDGTRVLLDEDDSPPLTDEELRTMRPAHEVLPAAFLQAWREGRVGRPEKEVKKQQISLRLDPDVIAAYRSYGKGWQQRINETLRKHMTD